MCLWLLQTGTSSHSNVKARPAAMPDLCMIRLGF